MGYGQDNRSPTDAQNSDQSRPNRKNTPFSAISTSMIRIMAVVELHNGRLSCDYGLNQNDLT
jgi:hypothetical protein